MLESDVTALRLAAVSTESSLDSAESNVVALQSKPVYLSQDCSERVGKSWCGKETLASEITGVGTGVGTSNNDDDDEEEEEDAEARPADAEDNPDENLHGDEEPAVGFDEEEDEEGVEQ